MASTFARWRSLQLGKSATPPLYVKHTLDAAAYEITVTDLTNVWRETLEPDVIYRRAEHDNCAINPRDDDKQLKILFEKIATALDGAVDTYITLSTYNNDDTLVLHIKAPLPLPLPPLEWETILKRLSPRSLTSEVLCPVILDLHQKHNAIEQLQRQLHDKDQIISRLLDRLESSGTDLTTVFPGTSGVRISRKIPQRGQLERYVRGLPAFDRKDSKPSLDSTPVSRSLFDVVGTMSPRRVQSLSDVLGECPQSWWSTMASPSTASSTSSRRKSKSASLDPLALAGEETEDEYESDFQVQEAPTPSKRPRLHMEAHARDIRSPSTVSRNSTPDQIERFSSARISSSPALLRSSPMRDWSDRETPPTQPPSERNTPKKLGVIGGRSQNSLIAPHRPPAISMSPESSKTLKQKTQHLPGVQRPVSRLGLIGGGMSQSQQVKEFNRPSSPIPSIEKIPEKEEVKSEPVGTSPSHIPAASTIPPRISARGRSVASIKPEHQTPGLPRESSRERADKRREDLKNQLASQAETARKKKRKF